MSEKQDLLKRVFGMLKDQVRIYQIAEDREVVKDEFQYCQVMFNLVFGKDGYAETLGPTWRMIHDPRFQEIENLMIVDRHAIFGGDARLGKQYINDDGSFSSTVGDLEKYAELLGEGRNFYNILVHPDKNCQVRLWLERIYRGFTNIQPYGGFECQCTSRATSPYSLKDADEETVWNLIKQECPNRAFNQDGTANAYGKLIHSLIRADLVGLVADYARTPLIDSYVFLRDHGVVQAAETVDLVDPHGQEAPRVLQEIDILEQALTHRATMRVTAYKIFKKIGMEAEIRRLAEDGFELTDVERDEMLRLVYESDYPQGDVRDPFFRIQLDEWEKKIKITLTEFLEKCQQQTYELRSENQLGQEKANAERTIRGLLDGSVKPINSYTEPVAEIPDAGDETDVTKFSRMMEAIMGNEYKMELYLLMVEAERTNDTAVLDILTPVFHTSEFTVDERTFYNILESIRIGSRSLRAERLDAIRGIKQVTEKKLDPRTSVQEHEGEWHSKDNPGGMFR
jgi:hypothetical protein